MGQQRLGAHPHYRDGGCEPVPGEPWLGVRAQDGHIIIEPLHPREYDLARLLAGITSDNLHAEVSSGPAVGREAF